MVDKRTKHPLEAIEGVIKVRDAKAPKESAEDMRERLIAEMRQNQQNRKIIPPKHSGSI